MMAGAEQRKSPTKNKRGGGLSIPVKGGAGILIVGGTLIALGAAFLFRRFRANKRRLPPPPPNPVDEIQGKLANDAAKAKGLSDGCDPRIGLQSILLPIHQQSQDLAAAVVSEIDHTTVIEDVVKKIEFREVEEVKEVEEIEEKHDKEEPETLATKSEEETPELEKHDKEEPETLATESEEETPELPFDETGSSSVESSVAAVWPADMIKQEEDMMEQEEESPVMEMKETAEAEKDCVPEVMKLKLKTNMENLEAMQMMKMSEKNQHYKSFIMLLALLVAFGLLFCKDAVFHKIN